MSKDEPSPPAAGAGRPLLNDTIAGLAAAIVVLPQAMAFGVALLSPFGFDASRGALAGLISAASLSLVSGLFGGTMGLVSAPCGPVFVLLLDTLGVLAARGVSGASLLLALTAILVLAGSILVAIGLSGGGRLIKYIPWPVMAGFMTGAAVLMIRSQIKPLTGGIALSRLLHDWGWLPLAVAALTYAIMEWVPRRWPAVPPTVAGLFGGTLVFHCAIALGPGKAPESWIIGTLPGFGAVDLSFSVGGLAALPMSTLLSTALALAILAALDTLMNSVIADAETGVRHDARRELIGQGIGHIVAGLLGGTGGSGTTAATVVCVKTGGRRWAAVVTGATCVLLVLFFGGVGRWLAISVLAAIIIRAAIHMIVWDALTVWPRYSVNRVGSVVALTVAGVTVVEDMMLGVAVGVCLAILMFIRAQVKAPVIHRRSTGDRCRSLRSRKVEENRLLDSHGDRVVLYELRGNLMFATADRLFSELLPDLDRPAWVILQLRRVQLIDLTGLKILLQIAGRLHRNGGHLIFSEVHDGTGVRLDLARAMLTVGGQHEELSTPTFMASDEALEYAENALLAQLGMHPVGQTEGIDLAHTAVGRDLSPDQLVALRKYLGTRRVETGEVVFSRGQAGQELYFVVSGEIDIRIPTDDHRYTRVATYGPGTMFGEIAFLEPGPRSADAVAVLPGELSVLARSAFLELSTTAPEVAIALLMALARMEGASLRRANEELTHLSQW
ncbi:MAG: SLC26A/SulP transporter family protein [Candidatus Riflebacteria bacterium]|nr:SLC26A/SulP transporter family protein [Candidatus Riflebacteria bacterium]